jgi:hypothetical protein
MIPTPVNLGGSEADGAASKRRGVTRVPMSLKENIPATRRPHQALCSGDKTEDTRFDRRGARDSSGSGNCQCWPRHVIWASMMLGVRMPWHRTMAIASLRAKTVNGCNRKEIPGHPAGGGIPRRQKRRTRKKAKCPEAIIVRLGGLQRRAPAASWRYIKR